MRNFNKVDMSKAIAYGIGYVCGRHNLKLSKKEIKNTVKDYLKIAENEKL